MLNNQDLVTGGIFIAVGTVYGGIAIQSLPMGTAAQMGPGYWPLVLSGLLLAIGAAVIVRAVRAGVAVPIERVPVRAILVISAAIAFFALLLEHLGLFPAVAATSLIASFARSGANIPAAVLVSLAIGGFCTAVFIFGVGIQLPVFGDWLAFWS